MLHPLPLHPLKTLLTVVLTTLKSKSRFCFLPLATAPDRLPGLTR